MHRPSCSPELPIGVRPLRVSKLTMRLNEQGGPHYVVAEAAGFSKSRLSEYQSGARSIPPHHVIAICEVLRCTPDEILGTEEVDEFSVG